MERLVEKPGNVHGRVLGVDDVGVNSKYSLRALVIAVPSASFESLLIDTGYEGDTSESYSWVRISISSELFISYVDDFDYSETDGFYALELEPGEYMFCLANLNDDGQPGEIPEVANVQGCVNATVPVEGQLERDIYKGEAGVY